MNEFGLITNEDYSTTSIPNVFINHFMPKCSKNASYVMVYLEGLKRCYNKKESWASNKTIADKLNLAERTVIRAWQYWEKQGIVEKRRRYLKTKKPKNQLEAMDYSENKTSEYQHQSSNFIGFLDAHEIITKVINRGDMGVTPPTDSGVTPTGDTGVTLRTLKGNNIKKNYTYKNKFHNFTQRDLDYSEIEKMIQKRNRKDNDKE